MYHPKQKPSKIKELSSSELAVVHYNFFGYLYYLTFLKLFQVEQVFLWGKKIYKNWRVALWKYIRFKERQYFPGTAGLKASICI